MPEKPNVAAPRREVHELSNGRRLELQSLTLRDFEQIRQQSLASFRRDYVRSMTDTATPDILPDPADRQRVIDEARRAASKLTLDDCPEREVIVLDTDESGKVRRDAMGQDATKKQPAKYWVWWMSHTVEGMEYTVWLSSRRAGMNITLDEADELWSELRLRSGDRDLEEAAERVGALSEATLAPPQDEADPTNPGKAREEVGIGIT